MDSVRPTAAKTVESQPANPVVAQSLIPNPPTENPSTSKWLVIFLLIFFPPFALYYMWKEKKFHSWFGVLLLCNAVLGLVVHIATSFFIIPQLLAMYKNLNITVPSMDWVMPSLYLGVIISLAQLFFGVYLWRRVKKYGALSKKLLTTAVILLAINLLIPAAGSVLSYIPIMQSVYDLLNNVQ